MELGPLILPIAQLADRDRRRATAATDPSLNKAFSTFLENEQTSYHTAN